MKIIHDFPGANINIVDIKEKDITLRTEIKDSMDWWFHWSFAVEDALGMVAFRFADNETIGYMGPAISYDRVNWNWLGSHSRIDGKTFVYDFKNKDRIYFAFSMQYQISDFERFYEKQDHMICRRETLTKSKQGRDIPLIKVGDDNAKNHIILTARHHACESTGSYVLQGVISELAKKPIANYLVSAVPFMDIDGVENGDQGKNRAPHDHNRDYIDNPIYMETKALMEYTKNLNVKIMMDFHSPGKWGGCDDYIGFIKKFKVSEQQVLDGYCDILESATKSNELRYYRRNNYDNFWMTEEEDFTTCCGYFSLMSSSSLSICLEAPYTGIGDNINSQSNMIQLGQSIAIALKKYITNL